MGVTANLRQLDHWIERIRTVKSELLPLLARRQAATLGKLVADEFRQGLDPYGNPWAPVFRNRKRDVRARARRAKQGKPPRADKPLVDTGRLRGSIIARVEGTSVRVSLPVEYASYHQYGTRRIKRRQILPEVDTGGLPPKWMGALTVDAIAVLNDHFKKGR